MGAALGKELDKARAKEVHELDLRNKGITELPPNIGAVETLIRLNLSANKLKTLPPQIGNLHNLTSLNLFNNKLKELPQEITKLSDLGWCTSPILYTLTRYRGVKRVCE